MNIKVNGCFLILIIFSIFLGILSFIHIDSRNIENIYIHDIEKIFNDLNGLENMFIEENNKYMETNVVSKYFVKEIRDGYTDIKFTIISIINNINRNLYYCDLNKRYLVNLLNDLLTIIDNEFLKSSIFYSTNDFFIKNTISIIDKCRFVVNKYNLLKFNFGLTGI